MHESIIAIMRFDDDDDDYYSKSEICLHFLNLCACVCATLQKTTRHLTSLIIILPSLSQQPSFFY